MQGAHRVNDTTSPTTTSANTTPDTQLSFGEPLARRPRSLAERPLREWPARERPIERLTEVGAASLSDSELLALLFGSAGRQNPVTLAQALLSDHGGWRGLQRITIEELVRQPGVTRVRAAQLKAALEIARRLLLISNEDRFQIKSPNDVAQLLMVEMSHLDQEHLRVVNLDTKNRVQKITTVYIGSVNSSAVRVGEIFKEAIRLNSPAVIIVHNHPSGQPDPSPEDILVTRQIVDAGKLLDVDVLDHLVIGNGRFVSMRERGVGFPKK
jgi:DNA repair protein RadC